MIERIKSFYFEYERHISSGALLGGFVFDSITLQRIDLLFENIVILSYLTLSGGGILLLNYLKENPPQRSFFINLEKLLPLFVQFAFGGLFSGFFIFYSRSATLSSSWPFVLILLTLLIGNEFFKEQYRRITFQISIYFVAIFSFFIFFVPILVKSISPFVFILSGFVSLVFIKLFITLLSKITPTGHREGKKNLKVSITLIFILINILYFSNLIPPIPLSLKEVGVYHNVVRVGGDYEVLKENRRWWQSLIPGETYHLIENNNAYVFSSVFAPTDLNTKIVHDWQYFDEERNEWVSTGKISYNILGGRDGGYRGFSEKENIFEGKWRVDIKTERNQIIGRVKFRVKKAESILELKKETL